MLYCSSAYVVLICKRLPERGCPVAAVRVWKDQGDMPEDMCGEALPAHQMQVRNTLRKLYFYFISQ